MQPPLHICLFVFWCFLCCLSKTLFSQYEENRFVRYTIQNGLSNNYITCIQQDDWGNLWVGTAEGLNRFDGNTFTNFYKESAPLNLPSSIIFRIKKFGPHKLGIITRGGFQLVNTQDLSYSNYLIPDTTPFTTYRNNVYDVANMHDGSFALTTASGFYVVDKKGAVSFRYDAYGVEDIGTKRIMYGRDILQMAEEEYFIFEEKYGIANYNAISKQLHKVLATDKAPYNFYPLVVKGNPELIVRHKISKNEFLFFHLLNEKMVYFDNVLKKTIETPIKDAAALFNWESKIEKINDTTFCINGGQKGFYLFNLNRQTGQVKWNTKKYLPDFKIQCLFIDNDKRLWAGTSKGLLQQKFEVPFIDSYVLLPDTARTFIGAYNAAYRFKNKLYIGRKLNEGGLLIVDPVSMKVEKEIKFYGNNNKSNHILSIQMYHRDTLWIGTLTNLLWFDTKTHRYGDVFKEKFGKEPWADFILAPPKEDGYGWMLIGIFAARYHIASRTFSFYTDTTSPKIPFYFKRSIAYDAFGDVWFSGNSLARWNSQKQIFDTLIKVYGGPNKYNNEILMIRADNAGSLWLHNVENGLLEYRIKERKFIHYGRKNGLPAEVLESMSPVIQDQLWLGSSDHLIRFNTKTKKINIYDADDGFLEDRVESRKMYYDSIDNRLYMLCTNSVIAFPATTTKAGDSSEILISELLINGSKSFYYPSNNFELKYNENNLTLRFSVIDFENNNYQLSYLINNAENWTSLNKERTLHLTGLPAGKYLIHLRMLSKSGEQKLASFSFLITPPFWNTVWFYLGTGLLVLAISYLAYHLNIKRVQQKADIDKLLAQTELKALHAQMNPHFISNSLNSIREMILNEDNRQASRYLTKFAHLIRVTLDQSRHSFISVRNTIDYLNRYIEMEQVRNNKFTCNIYTDEELDIDHVFLPPMLIQPFVENAIWHGAAGTNNTIEVNIQFKKEIEHLVCIVEDNGIGIEKSLSLKTNSHAPHQSVAVSNIRQRINLLNEKYNLHSSVAIEDKANAGLTGTGTRVILKLPLQISKLEGNYNYTN